MIDIQAMFPVMVASNLAELQAFYSSMFGFQTVFLEPGFYLHLISLDKGIQLGFLVPGHESQPAFLHSLMHPNGYIISFEVADAARAFEQAKALGLSIVMDLKEEQWGQLHFIVKDPAGLHIDIVEHLQIPD